MRNNMIEKKLFGGLVRKAISPVSKIIKGLVSPKTTTRTLEDYKPIKELFQKHFPVRGTNVSVGQRLDQLEFDIGNLLHGTDRFRRPQVLPEFDKYGINLKLLRENIPELKKALKHNSYTEGIEINPVKELYKAGTIKTHEALFSKKLIGDFFHKDCYPRVIKALEDQGINLTAGLKKYVEAMYKEPWKFVKMEQGYMNPSMGGFSRGTNYIKLREGAPDSTVVHELHHSLRSRLSKKLMDWGYSKLLIRSSLTPEVRSGNADRHISLIFNPQYTDTETARMSMAPEFTKSQKMDLTPDAEIGATTVETRFDLFKRATETNGGKTPDKLQMDMILDMSTPEDLTSQFEKHGYGKWLSLNPTWREKTRPFEFYRNNTNSIKELMKYIGMGAGAVALTGAAVAGTNNNQVT